MKALLSVTAQLRVLWIVVLIASMCFFNSWAPGQLAEAGSMPIGAAKPAWLEGTGKDLRIRLAGEVLDETGASANDCKVTATLTKQFNVVTLPVTIKQNSFQLWVPVGDLDAFHVHLNVATGDGRRIARETVSAFQLRQAAVDGLKLTTKPPGRFLDVTVVDNGRPVPGASVVANVEDMPFTGKTNTTGVARFPLQKGDRLSQLTAWSDDFRIGGYSFRSDRDPLGSKFTIELEKCRPQVIRVINDESKAPVPQLPFFLIIGTGPPNYQWLGQTPGREMTTNDKGEAVYRWFPDWKSHGSCVELRDPRWIKAAGEEIIDGAIVVKVKKSRFDSRKHVVGRVTSPGNNLAGLRVEMSSFQGEEENRMEMLYAFTDVQGKFAADYLPGLTYCIFVNDARYVSNIIDLILYDPVTGKTKSPSLMISEGQPVEISVTKGPTKSPVAHQSVSLTTPHEYSWPEGRLMRRGDGGRRWSVTTNEEGKARTFALPGEKLEGSLYTSEWRSRTSAEVMAGGITQLDFHRELARKVRGRLVLTPGAVADLKGADIEIGSVDGDTSERFTRTTDNSGEFSFDSIASRIGIYVRTKDLRAAGIAVFERLDRPLEVSLKPTGEFRGRLLGKENRPQKDHAVHAAINVSEKEDYSKLGPTSFLAASIDAKTDGDGNYSFSGLPCEVAIGLNADSLDGSDQIQLDQFYLIPRESRPRIVSRLWKAERKLSFSERYERALRDCRLSNFAAMVILYRPAEDTKQFVETNFLNYGTTKEVMAFIQLQGLLGGKSENEVAAFAKSRGWPLPRTGKVFAVAMDPTGREVGRMEIDVKDPTAPELAAEFISKRAPAPDDAREKWDEAFALARQSGRKVWAQIGHRYCVHCYELSRWLDDQKNLLARDYVFLKINCARDFHGMEIADRLTGWKLQGTPFHAIFDSDGRMLITSESVLGNIACPGGYEGKKHLRKMLVSTRKNLTDQQIDHIVNSLGD